MNINTLLISYLAIVTIGAPTTVVGQPAVEVGPIGITVSDMDRALVFYSSVLGFTKVSDQEFQGKQYDQLLGVFGIRMRMVRMRLGQEGIDLIDFLTPGGRPIPEDSKSNDLWFQHIAIVVSDMEKAYAHLRSHSVQHVSPGPQTIPVSNRSAAGIKAFYFRDPDGNNLELIYFPKDKGQPKWQQKTDQLFLGIDHTAIGVSNTEKSLKFYQTILGLKLVGESYNHGPEQEYLNNVFGASLHISGLKTLHGPGIELLEYITPKNGRAYPIDTKADDLIHWQTTIKVDKINQLSEWLKLEGYSFISTKIIDLPDQHLGFQHGFMVRDPDGHALLITD